MLRTTITLPSDLKMQAEQEARQRGISLSELVRQSLIVTLSANKVVQDAEDPLLADDAVYSDDAPDDMAEHHDNYLYGNHQQ